MKFASLIPIALLAFLFIGCPPPAMRLNFQSGNVTSKSLAISEDSIKITVEGILTPLSTTDYLYVKFKFQGYTIPETAFCDKVFSFESNKLHPQRRHPWDSFEEPFCAGSENCCYVNLYYDHKDIQLMTREEAEKYVDSLSLSFEINGVFKEKRRVDAIFDKKWLIKRFQSLQKILGK